MKNTLKEYMQKLIALHALDSKDDLLKLLTENNEVIKEIINHAKSNYWVNFEENTYDGWYCVKCGTEFNIYYQERGRVEWDFLRTESKEEAVASVMTNSGYLE